MWLLVNVSWGAKVAERKSDLLGAGDMARLIGCDRARICYLLDRGRIPVAARVAGRRLIARQHLPQVVKALGKINVRGRARKSQ
jgi:hypothetical protein